MPIKGGGIDSLSRVSCRRYSHITSGRPIHRLDAATQALGRPTGLQFSIALRIGVQAIDNIHRQRPLSYHVRRPEPRS